jgi:hypothetical protein
VLSITDELVDRLLPMATNVEFETSPREDHARFDPDGTNPKDRLWVEIPEGLGFSQTANQIERQYLGQLYLRHRGDLQAMARQLLGPKGNPRQVHLRLNQLGLGIKALRQKLMAEAVRRTAGQS